MGEIPDELGQLSRLEGLALGGNQLTGDIPSELGQLTQLRELFLYGNQLTGEMRPTGLRSRASWASCLVCLRSCISHTTG